MVIPASLALVTGGPCQDNAPDTSDLLCIDLLGGEILPSQLNCLSADQESKKFYPLDSTHQDLMDLLLPSPPLENVDTSELPMSNAVLKPTMPQVPDFPDVAQALSGHSTANLLHAKDTIGDDIWTNVHPPPLVAPSSAPNVPDRPPAAPDPVTGVTLPTTIPPNHCTTMQFGQPPNGTVQTTPATVALPETHDPYDCHHSEMQLSDPMEEAVQPAPVIGSYANTSGYAICSASPIVIPHDLALPPKGNFQDHHGYHELLCSQRTLPVSCESLDVHLFAMPYASDLLGIEEEIIFSTFDENEEDDNEEVLLEIEPCIPFSAQLFHHHDGIFLQTLCELELSSMEMIHQKHILCLDDFSYGEPSTVIAGEEPAIGEQDLSGTPMDSTGLLPDVYHSSRYNQSKGHMFFTKDGEFIVASYPNEGDSVGVKVHTHGPKCIQFPILQFVLIEADEY